jgi:phage shock protein A
MIEDENLTVTQQQHLKQVRQKVEEFEKRMNYKAQPLSEEDQDLLDAKFHNAQRMRRWVE